MSKYENKSEYWLTFVFLFDKILIQIFLYKD